jgi:hypothetical protein
MTAKLSIVQVIGSRRELRPIGKELVGLCPFHNDRHPSLFVNDAKGVFLCRSCGMGGNAITFLMKLDGITYSNACRTLGIKIHRHPRPLLTANRIQAAATVAAWANHQMFKFNVLIADGMERINLADEIGDTELAERFERELVVLRAFYASLRQAASAIELVAVRESIEQITDGAEVSL